MTTHKVLVLGAGYAGTAAAIQLAARTKGRDDVEVTLVNAHETFTERLRLHLTATGQQVAELSIPELLDGTGARFVRGWVTALDPDTRTVRVDDDRVLHYDTLVYALGGVADTVTVPGVEEHAQALNSPEDAEVLAARLAARYKEAVTASPWPTYLRMKKMPASGAFWPRGGRFTRVRR